MAPSMVIPFNMNDTASWKPTQTLKWSINNTHYEVTTAILDSMEIQELVPHCVEWRDQVLSRTVFTKAHKAHSFYGNFGRTLSSTLHNTWSQLLEDATNNINVDNSETILHFDERLHEFMAEFFTAEDCCDLVKQLRTAKKPRPVAVQNFYHSMQTLNQSVKWLSSSEPALTADQLKNAFKEAMPLKWQDEFSIAGQNQQDMTMAEVLRYFRQREKKAQEAEANNQHKQHQTNGKGKNN